MEDSPVTYLESIKIEKLWGEVDIEWNLDPKVNILVGRNGTGKTTILNLIEGVSLTVPRKGHLINNINSILLNFDRSYIKVSVVNDSVNLEESDDNLITLINLETISTFDMYLKDWNEINYHRMKNGINYQIQTELDIILQELVRQFKGYLLKLRNREKEETALLETKIKQLSTQDNATQEELQHLRDWLIEKDQKVAQINAKKHLFLDKINELFSDTDKTIDFDAENSIIFRKSHDKTISVYQLSSGEKQILIILLKILLQENKPYIVLMDEPELSLHLAWQLQLINIIQQLNENCQLIIATHAPGIFSKGWNDKITKMEDIIKEST